MKLSKILLLPITIPVLLYVGVRLLYTLGPKAVPFVKELGADFDNRMCYLDQLFPQGSYTHKKAVRELRESCRKRIKEAYVKKS